MATGARRQRAIITQVRPSVDGGRFAAKAMVGQPVEVRARIFADGHDLLLAWARYGRPSRSGGGSNTWREAPLWPCGNDRWTGHFIPTKLGRWAFEVVAMPDTYGSWLRDLLIRHQAGQELGVELEVGAELAERHLRSRHVSITDRRTLGQLRDALHAGVGATAAVAAAGRPAAVAAMRRTADRSAATVEGPYPLWVDRELGGVSAWYEFFPRSEGATPACSGTFATAAKRLPAIAAMGFDIVYLPPVHPIGVTFRKGRNNTADPAPEDPGSPWAIGGPEGGHTAVHPDLGTFDDFDRFVAAARGQGLEVALDYALQCSPDHPWVRQHPQWFKHRPDGSIRYAENPPKKYQDIYPLDFDTDDAGALWAALRDVLLFWIDHGVHVFRVDNPHTKPFAFWEWVIAAVRRRHPEVIFLSEAFTRPVVMHHLAKAGFTQSYTYFTWRNDKQELSDYLSELSQDPSVDYFRPNFWPNTPDILHQTLQHGGMPAFRLRLVLAAMCSPSWGMYSGYELGENTAVRRGSEEYLDSEKYQLRPRQWDRPGSLAPLIARVNAIRHRHRQALSLLRTLRLQPITGERLLCVSRVTDNLDDVLLVIVNLDPHNAAEGTTWLDLPALGVPSDRPFDAHDELTGTTYVWQGPSNYVRLDPHSGQAAHILHLRAR